MEPSTIPVSLIEWLLCAWVLMSISKLALWFIDRNKPHPPAGELAVNAEALAERVLKLESAMAKLWEHWEKDKTEIIEAGEVRAIKIHERINALSDRLIWELGQLKGKVDK